MTNDIHTPPAITLSAEHRAQVVSRAQRSSRVIDVTYDTLEEGFWVACDVAFDEYELGSSRLEILPSDLTDLLAESGWELDLDWFRAGSGNGQYSMIFRKKS